MIKQALTVLVEYSSNGIVTPRSFVWNDEISYTIDRVIDRRTGCSLKHGVLGMRYTCMVGKRKVYLFQEHDKWYLDV